VIAFLEGEVVGKSAGRAVLAVNGIGYEVSVPSSVLASLPPVGRSARVYTRMVVRDDAMVLYGFSSTDERDSFDALTGVSGVGPKVALAFLSTLTSEALRRAVASGDVAALTVVPGVGKKVAQRVVIDLRESFGGGGDGELEELSGPIADVREALRSLGLTPQEAGSAIAGLEADGRDVEDLLRDALQRVGRA
jgi:Holliday junction DNA helicase RuvA